MVIGLIFGYLYRDVGIAANTVFANYIYFYGSILLVVYTGKMPVTLCCEVFIKNAVSKGLISIFLQFH